jgi:hypothetical protein
MPLYASLLHDEMVSVMEIATKSFIAFLPLLFEKKELINPAKIAMEASKDVDGSATPTLACEAKQTEDEVTFSSYVWPKVVAMAESGRDSVRANAARVLNALAPLVSSACVEMFLRPLMLRLARDERESVKSVVVLNLEQFYVALPREALVEHILPLFEEFHRDNEGGEGRERSPQKSALLAAPSVRLSSSPSSQLRKSCAEHVIKLARNLSHGTRAMLALGRIVRNLLHDSDLAVRVVMMENVGHFLTLFYCESLNVNGGTPSNIAENSNSAENERVDNPEQVALQTELLSFFVGMAVMRGLNRSNERLTMNLSCALQFPSVFENLGGSSILCLFYFLPFFFIFGIKLFGSHFQLRCTGPTCPLATLRSSRIPMWRCGVRSPTPCTFWRASWHVRPKFPIAARCSSSRTTASS